MARRRLYNWAGGLVALLMLVTTGTAHAAPSIGLHLTTSPLPIRLSTTPGSTVTTSLRVKNSGSQTEKIAVGLMKFSASNQTGQPNLFERGRADSYFDWVSFTPNVFSAPPNQWMDVKMSIKVPKQAGLGYYYAVTFQRATNAANPSVPAPQTSVIGATATLVLLDVKTPDEKRTLQLTQFYTDHRLYQFLPVTFKLQVHNTGNIFLAPGGNIFIKKGDKTVATLDVNAGGGSVLPKSPRLFSAEWKDGFPVYTDTVRAGKPVLTKSGEPARHVSWNTSQLSKLRFGKYTAEALLVYNDGKHDIPMQASVSFWVVPWGLVALAVLVPLVPAVTVYLLMHGRTRRHKNWRSAR